MLYCKFNLDPATRLLNRDFANTSTPKIKSERDSLLATHIIPAVRIPQLLVCLLLD